MASGIQSSPPDVSEPAKSANAIIVKSRRRSPLPSSDSGTVTSIPSLTAVTESLPTGMKFANAPGSGPRALARRNRCQVTRGSRRDQPATEAGPRLRSRRTCARTEPRRSGYRSPARARSRQTARNHRRSRRPFSGRGANAQTGYSMAVDRRSAKPAHPRLRQHRLRHCVADRHDRSPSARVGAYPVTS